MNYSRHNIIISLILAILAFIALGYAAFRLSLSPTAFNRGGQVAAVGDVTSGLVGHWSFDDNSGTTAIDSSGNNASLNAATPPAWTSPGKVGQSAISYAGNQVGGAKYLTIPNIPSYQFGTGDFTVAFWVKSPGSPPDTLETYFYSSTLKIYVYPSQGQVWVQTSDGNMVNYVNIADNTWHHIAVVRSAGTISIYVDAGFGISSSAPSTISNADASIYLGANSTGGSNAIGSQDELYMFSRALSQDDIVVLFGNDLTPPTVTMNSLSGTQADITSVSISASASDTIRMGGVQFKVDNGGTIMNIGSEVTSPSSGTTYTTAWDPTTVSNGSHTLYAVARDASNNYATSTVSVTVNNNLVPPTISNGLPTGTLTANTTQTSLQVTTNIPASCRYDSSPNIPYASMQNAMSGNSATDHSVVIYNLTNNSSYTKYVRCQVTSLNPSTSDYPITFSVGQDNVAPIIQNPGVSSPAQTSVTINWSTNELATSQVEYGTNNSYGTITTLVPQLVSYHTITLTGLTPATTYHYHVISNDAAGNTSAPNDLTFTTASAAVASGNIYIAQTTKNGNDSGSSCTNPHSVAWLNAYNTNSLAMLHYGVAGGVNPGDIIHLCDTITSSIVLNFIGTPGNPITIYFEPNAKMSAPVWGTDKYMTNVANHPAIYSPSTAGPISYWIIDGGSNGLIEATDNGTGKTCKGAAPSTLFTDINGNNGPAILSALTNFRNFYGHGIISSDPRDSSKRILSDDYYHDDVNPNIKLMADLNTALANYVTTNATGTVRNVFDVYRMWGRDDSAHYTSGSKAGVGNTYCSDSRGIDLSGSNIEIKNIHMNNTFFRNSGDLDDTIAGVGINIDGNLNDISVHNNVLNMLGNAIQILYSGPVSRNVRVYSNTVTNMNFGLFVNSGSERCDAYDYRIYDNVFDHLDTWYVSGSGSFHGDGIILNTNTSSLNNVMHGMKVYSNRIGPNLGLGISSIIKNTPGDPRNYNGTTYFNNLLITGAGQTATNGFITPAGVNSVVLNNSFISYNAGEMAGGAETGTVFLNNLSKNVGLGISATLGYPSLVDYNAYDTIVTWPYTRDIDPDPIKTYFQTGFFGCFSGCVNGWRENYPSFDLHSNFNHPALDANYRPTTGDTAAIGKGKNLTYMCGNIPELCKDIEGNQRPSTGTWDIGAFQTSGGGVDNSPPDAPSNFVINSVLSSSIGFSWVEPQDNVGVSHYKIYRNATYLAQTASTAYTDSPVSPSTHYSYTVSAVDTSNNESVQSLTRSATTPGVGDSNLSLTAGPSVTNIQGTSATISWNTSLSSSGTVLYDVTTSYGSNVVDPLTTTSHSVAITGLVPNTVYHYQVSSTAGGNTVTSVGDATFTTSSNIDTIKPSTPQNLALSDITSSAIKLTWSGSTDNSGSISNYRVYRNNVYIGQTTGIFYNDSSLTALTLYSYKVSAVDASSNESDKSGPQSATTLGNSVQSLSFSSNPSASGLQLSSAIIGWNTSLTSSGTISYGVTTAYGSTMIDPLTSTSHAVTLSGLSPNTVYHYQVSASANGSIITSTDSTFTTASPGGGGGGGGGGGDPAPYTLTVQKIGKGAGTTTSLPAGINCGQTCNYSFRQGTTVTLMFKAVATSSLLAWSGCDSINQSICTITMNGPKTISSVIAEGGNSQPVTALTIMPSSKIVSGTPESSIVIGPLATLISLGKTSPEVKNLQIILNKRGYVIAASGNGSPGHETTYFGPATQVALRKFQCKTINLCTGTVATTGYGATGPKTRIALGTYTMTIPKVTVTPFVQQPITKILLNRALKIGSTGADVKVLQVFLNTHGFTIAYSGNGSKGHESTYYGQATATAVKKFQEAYTADLLRPRGLKIGTGIADLETIKKINTLNK